MPRYWYTPFIRSILLIYQGQRGHYIQIVQTIKSLQLIPDLQIQNMNQSAIQAIQASMKARSQARTANQQAMRAIQAAVQANQPADWEFIREAKHRANQAGKVATQHAIQAGQLIMQRNQLLLDSMKAKKQPFRIDILFQIKRLFGFAQKSPISVSNSSVCSFKAPRKMNNKTSQQQQQEPLCMQQQQKESLGMQTSLNISQNKEKNQ